MSLRPVFKSIFTVTFVLMMCLAASAQQGANKPGLHITRDELIKKLTEADRDLAFKQDTDINSLPNFIAIDANGSRAQLIGKPDELMIAKWSYVFMREEKANIIGLQKLAWFANTLGNQEGIEWFFAKLADMGKDYKKAFTDIKIFDSRRKAEIIYAPAQRTFTITFTPW